ncbi:MAG: hypothetical protein ABIF40_02555 [archaeon]
MKSLIKKSFELYFNKWWKFLVLDLAFVFFLSLLVLYSRFKLKTYFVQIQLFQDQISTVQNLFVENATMAQLQFTTLLEQLYPITAKIQVFFYIIIPIGFFILWCLSQGFSFNLIKSSKFYNSEHMYKFFALSFPGILILTLLLKMVLDMITSVLFEEVPYFFSKLVLGLILLAFVLYVMFLSYAVLTKLDLSNFGKLVQISFKKFFKLFPLFLLFLFLTLLFLFFYFSLLVSLVGQSIVGIVLGIIFVLIFVILLGLFRTFYVLYVKKQKLL